LFHYFWFFLWGRYNESARLKQIARMAKIQNTRDKIIEVAKGLFMKKGVDKTSVRDIARSAGINIAALNYHFRSKEKLFDQIFEHVLANTVPSLPNILNSYLPLEEKITQYVDAYIDVLVKNPQLTYFVISVLNRDPKKIQKLNVFKSLYSTALFTRQLNEEAERGNIKPVDADHFFVNMLSLINFPFMIQDILKEKDILEETDFKGFIRERKAVVTETLLRSIRREKSPVAKPRRVPMYIHAIGHYIPEERVDNAYYGPLVDMPVEEIFKKSGIRERRKAAAHENTNTMAVEAVECMLSSLKIPITDIDLIVAATYTPWDTVATPAHAIQRKYRIKNSRAFMVSSACSSFVTAVELVEGYFNSGKARNALVVVSEHNTAFNDDSNKLSGFLWGDGAAAMVITKDRLTENDMEILDIDAEGLAHISKGPDAVYCRINSEKIQMPDGKDVFVNASKYMARHTIDILERNNYTLENLNYLIPHQANMRIINKVGNDLKMTNGRLINNIEYLGNTGCAGCAIGLSENWNIIRKGEIAVVTVFGGGYSSGSMLLRK
jgi:3-oxoacyl-[acyl-carrier-protein] synthase III